MAPLYHPPPLLSQLGFQRLFLSVAGIPVTGLCGVFGGWFQRDFEAPPVGGLDWYTAHPYNGVAGLPESVRLMTWCDRPYNRPGRFRPRRGVITLRRRLVAIRASGRFGGMSNESAIPIRFPGRRLGWTVWQEGLRAASGNEVPSPLRMTREELCGQFPITWTEIFLKLPRPCSQHISVFLRCHGGFVKGVSEDSRTGVTRVGFRKATQ